MDHAALARSGGGGAWSMARTSANHDIIVIDGLGGALEALPGRAVVQDPADALATAAQEPADMRADDMRESPSRFTCPECHGALWEIEDGSMLRCRCHVRHAFATNAALASQDDEIDRLLGTLLHSHQERAALASDGR
jgi:two-component system, chemotaxis family, protein-glutamate methylesterase/glutaminase